MEVVLWSLFIFILSVSDDCLVVWYMRRVVEGKKGTAGILSGALTVLISLEVFIYVSDWRYIVPNAVGSVVGTWLALWIEERLPRIKPRDKKTGRFKPTPTVATFQQGEKI